jgi:hypothetical protein
MKVLRESKSWILEHECTGWGNTNSGCGALLGVEQSDLRYFSGGFSSDSAVCFKCICCGVVTNLGLNDWPSNFSELTPWTYAWETE